MAKQLNNQSLEEILDYLNNGFVISKRKYQKHDSGDIGKLERNILQIVKKDGELSLINFDSYGNKKKDDSIIKEDGILSILKINKDSECSYYKEVVTSHKLRVSKKSLNSEIIDEASAKLMVYQWLLKKYSKEDDVIVPEITLGDKRADYITFGNNETCIVEIKSEVDTIDRLQEQIDRYVLYGSYVYIAIHTTKIKSLESLSIPPYVGILEIGKKLKLVKKAKKQKIDFCIFLSHLSYSDIKGMSFGMKMSSKFEKEDIEDIFHSSFTNKEKAMYALNSIKNKCKKESLSRKKLYHDGDKEKSIGNASSVGINRMQNNAMAKTLINAFDLNKNYLVSLNENMEKKFKTKYKNYKYANEILEDKMLFRAISMLHNISDHHLGSRYFRLKIMLEKSSLFIDNKVMIINFIDRCMIDIIDVSINKPAHYFISTYSRLTVDLIIERLSEANIGNKFVKSLNGGWTNKVSRDMFDGKTILITAINKQIFYSCEDNVKKIEPWGTK